MSGTQNVSSSGFHTLLGASQRPYRMALASETGNCPSTSSFHVVLCTWSKNRSFHANALLASLTVDLYPGVRSASTLSNSIFFVSVQIHERGVRFLKSGVQSAKTNTSFWIWTQNRKLNCSKVQQSWVPGRDH